MQDLISIIIPIYNAEKYIDKCISSVIKQTYQNLEIILVDDGSTDFSRKIVDNYKKRDKRITVKHITNSGVSAARNIGLSIASGKYIGFVDSDDYIETTMIEELYNSIVNYNSDMAICNIFFENENAILLKELHYDNIFLNREEFIKAVFYVGCIRGYTCNKLYSTKIIKDKNIKFDEKASVLEDDIFNIQISCNNKQLTISYIDKQLYHYVSHSSSVSNTDYNIKKLSYFYVRNTEINMLENENIDVNYLKIDYCAAFIRAKILMKKNKIERTGKFYKFSKYFKKYKKEIKFCNLSKKMKIKYLVVKFFPFAYKIKIIMKGN